MDTIHIQKGRNLKLKGAATQTYKEVSLPSLVAVQPCDFRGLKPRLVVKEGDRVKVGSPLFIDKANEAVKVLSPASGTVCEIRRGDKRALKAVVIKTDGKQESVSYKKHTSAELSSLLKENIIQQLQEGGLWPTLRQRPFSKIANSACLPKSIFVHAMNTEPLAEDVDFILEGQESNFQTGLDILSRLTDGKLHVCYRDGAAATALTQAKNVELHAFSGAHPTGNVSTHIHYVDPINKGDVVWYIEARDVLRIASLFTQGIYPSEKVVAVTGEGANENYYAKTIEGAPFSALLKGSDLKDMRCLSGSVLTGTDVGSEGFVCYYHAQITVIPRGGHRELLGWLMPGFNRVTFTKTFASAFGPQRDASIDTDEHGGHRAIVMNNFYDKYITLDILTYFLLKAVISGDIEEAEQLGILECDEEDFALSSFACPSKIDVGGIIREGLDLIELEG